MIPGSGILRDILTGVDGVTHDIGRHMAAASITTGLGLQVYVVVAKGQAFDFSAFGIGCGALAAGVGAMLRLKAGTEPAPQADGAATPPAPKA